MKQYIPNLVTSIWRYIIPWLLLMPLLYRVPGDGNQVSSDLWPNKFSLKREKVSKYFGAQGAHHKLQTLMPV